MTYIYDIILNYTDNNHVYEFFEWDKNDILDHIKKILLFRISPQEMNDIMNYNIEVTNSFLEKIKNKTKTYQDEKNITYSALFTDLNKIIALEFNKLGQVIARSSLLLDEEDEVISECSDLEKTKFLYTKKEKFPPKEFLTRNELFKRKYLTAEIKRIYKEDNEKLLYLYEELYGKSKKHIDKKYQKLLKDLEKNYSNIHNNLYEIVRLTYTKNIT